MQVISFVAGVTALASSVLCQTTPYTDPVSRITYQSFTNEVDISYRIALPANYNNATKPTGDVLLQLVGPIAIGWTGFAFGGHMVYDPLTVAWANGTGAVASSRMAFGLNLPQPYDGAEYHYLEGTGTNATHWTVNIRCFGCTRWFTVDGTETNLHDQSSTTFAYAYAATPVIDPADNTTAFNVHDTFGQFNADLTAAKSANYAQWVGASNPVVSSLSSAAPSPTNTTTSTLSTLSTSLITSPTASSHPHPSASIPDSCPGVTAARFKGTTAAGWKVVKVAGKLTSPRGIIFDSAGRLLIVQSGKGITAHTLDANGCTTAVKTVISDRGLSHGIQLSPDGKTLYASSMTTVFRYTYDSSTASVNGTGTQIIKGMFNGGHPTRTLLLSQSNPNLLLVSHGSNDNWDYESGNEAVARSCIKVFDLAQMPDSGYNYVTDGYQMGYGLRNEVAITQDANNMLWGVENSGDEFKRTINGVATDVHIDNPAEEVNYLGDVTKPNHQWYGYPTCFTVWRPDLFTDAEFAVGDQFVVTPNATWGDADCKAKSVAPKLAIQAHSAPIDSKFDADSQNLYVTLHGSWNRSPSTGFKVIEIPFTKGADGAFTPTAPSTSDKGYNDIFWNDDVTKCSSIQCFRPAGLIVDPQGRMYFTSDNPVEGEVFMIGQTV